HRIILAQGYAQQRAAATDLNQRAAARFTLRVGLFLTNVGDMDRSLTPSYPFHNCARPGAHRTTLLQPLDHLWLALRGNRAKALAIIDVEMTIGRFAQAQCFAYHRIKDGAQITERTIDHAQHLRRCSLLLQRLARLGDQPCVFHRDHRLIGERSDQFDLAFSEWLDPLPPQRDRSYRRALAQQGHPEYGTYPAKPGGLRWSVFPIGSGVVDVDNASFERDPPNDGAPVNPKPPTVPGQVRDPLFVFGQQSKTSYPAIPFALAAKDVAAIGCTKPSRGFDQGIEYGL